MPWARTSPRALVLRTLVTSWHKTPEEVAALADGRRHAPEPLSEAERAGLERDMPADAPAAIRGDYPEWLQPPIRAGLWGARRRGGGGARRAGSGRSQGQYAESDAREGAEGAAALSRGADASFARRGCASCKPRVPAEALMSRPKPGHGKGWYEVQDEGSQVAALLSGAKPKAQIIDLCAGAGGKTLALAALMQNTGQLYAYDSDRMRLRPIFERLKRAGVRNAQVLAAGDTGRLGRARRQDGPRGDRCALHRLGRVAAAARRQMAAQPANARGEDSRSSARCWRRGRRW